MERDDGDVREGDDEMSRGLRVIDLAGARVSLGVGGDIESTFNALPLVDLAALLDRRATLQGERGCARAARALFRKPGNAKPHKSDDDRKLKQAVELVTEGRFRTMRSALMYIARLGRLNDGDAIRQTKRLEARLRRQKKMED